MAVLSRLGITGVSCFPAKDFLELQGYDFLSGACQLLDPVGADRMADAAQLY
jgi:hypothetical protein